MKTLALILSLILFTTLVQSQDSKETFSITVTVDNAVNDDGYMLISLHTEDTFMKGKGIESTKNKIVDGIVTVTFKDLAPGNYAIMAFHDANDNGKMDFDTTGMPKESYGISNNPMLFGPPTYEVAKIDLVNEDMDITIRF